MKYFSRSLLTRVMTMFAREDGQTMAEYGVILAVITIAIVAILGTLSGQIQSVLSNVVNVLKSVPTG